jgi:hypothetical protein
LIERDYYSLAQASKILPYSKKDLIQFGACGKLPIYINWRVYGDADLGR